MDEYKHTPVLLNEVLNGLTVRSDGCYIDCTFGRGGHSDAILQRLNERGRLYILDKDPEAINRAEARFKTDSRVAMIHSNFSSLSKVADEHGITGHVDGLLFDLGVSSPQLDNGERGFSFMRDGNLDMRMDTSSGISAAQWINEAKQEEIAEVLRVYGEERFARRIATAIVKTRETTSISRTVQLAELIAAAIPRKERDKHPATRSFQAIRIFINRELDELKQVLDQVLDILNTGGRLAIISFHSLEDRIVKRFMRKAAMGDPYPHDLPVTVKELHARLKIIGKPLRASEEEVRNNPRSRSAVLRIGEKLAI